MSECIILVKEGNQTLISFNLFDGPRGDTGLSAYELDVENGFKGDYNAWRASLIGPPVPVAGELGQSTDLAVSQKLLTDSIADMEQSNEAAVTEATHHAGLAGDSAGIAAIRAGESAQSAQAAGQYAITATDQAGIATTKAGLAANSQVAAEQAATIATTKAGLASSSAGLAADSQVAAEQAATIAATKAGEASSSAVDAASQAGLAADSAAAAKQAENKFYPTLTLANADIANILVNQPIHVGEAVNGGLWYKATSGATALTKSAYDVETVVRTKVLNTFKTKALMDASALPVGTDAMVTDDSVADNNGMYVKTAGVWAKSSYDPAEISSKELRSKIRDDSGVDYIFAVADKNKNIAIQVQSPVVVDSNGGVDTNLITIGNSKSFEYVFSVSDLNGNMLLGVNKSGVLEANYPDTLGGARVLKLNGNYDAEINHILAYGQSLSVGQATPAISTVQKYDNLMFSKGMRPQYDYPTDTKEQWYAGLVPAIEAQSPTWSSLAETPSMGTGDAIKELILSEDGLSHTDMNYQLLMSAPGYGALSLNGLKKGTTHYTRLIEQVTAGKSLSQAANKLYKAQAVTWTQGESEGLAQTKEAYSTLFNQFALDLNTDIKAITGQTTDVALISYQIASHKVSGRTDPAIALAQLASSNATSNIYIATPTYHLTYQSSNNYHVTAESSRLLGAYYGLAYKRIVIDGEDWQPVRPLSSVKSGKFVNVKFNVPRGKLVLDTELVSENTNYGFELVTSAGVAIAITEVKIISPDTVKVVSNTAIPVGAKLRYAWSGAENVGRLTGARGNLRDTQGDDIVFDPDGINKAMHNWCVIFELEV